MTASRRKQSNDSSTLFLQALHACGASADRGADMDLYGWLIGSWELDVTRFSPDGTQRRRPGEWHFGWTLEGRAIQDVWIVPPRGAARHDDAAANANSYGTTIRVYDPKLQAWHIHWLDPVTQSFFTMIGRKENDAIVQFGHSPDGNLLRWSFSEITDDAFLWRGEISTDRGTTWRTNVEFRARRTSSQQSCKPHS
jgi:hypothetical protein